MNRYTIRDFKYESGSPMSRLQELENKVEDGEIVEVRHARWVGRKSRDYYTCSNCCTVSKSKDDEYCRGCGATMKGEDK